MLGSGLLLEYPYESDIPPDRMRVLEAKELWDPYCQPLLRLPKEILLLFGPDVDGVPLVKVPTTLLVRLSNFRPMVGVKVG